jgi:hypothetical protein
VVILDGRFASQATAVARYFLLQERMGVNKVHILRFNDDKQKAKFFAHYNFDTADYINVSTIIDEVKEWQRANRKTYGRTGGGGTATLKYLDVEKSTVKEAEVCLRDLEDGGVYVKTSRKWAKPEGKSSIRPYQLAEYLQGIAEYCGGDLDRVYCLPEGKIEAKWFQKAMDAGLWVEVTEYVKENAEVTVTDDMKRRYHYNAFVDEYDFCLNKGWMNAVTSRLSGASQTFNAYETEIVSDPDDFSGLVEACEYFDITAPDFGRSPVDFKRLLKDILDEYPIIKWMNIGQTDSVSKPKLDALVDYIEKMDSARKMLTMTPELV